MDAKPKVDKVEEMFSKMHIAVAGPLGAALIVGGFYMRGYTLATVWGWFVASTFGLPLIGVAQALGIQFLANFCFDKRKPSGKSITGLRMMVQGLHQLILCPMVLGTAWVLKQFI